jgi:hypothetical protein
MCFTKRLPVSSGNLDEQFIFSKSLSDIFAPLDDFIFKSFSSQLITHSKQALLPGTIRGPAVITLPLKLTLIKGFLC